MVELWCSAAEEIYAADAAHIKVQAGAEGQVWCTLTEIKISAQEQASRQYFGGVSSTRHGDKVNIRQQVRFVQRPIEDVRCLEYR
ncbi:hypothetical protein [Bradyrhizobium sp. STM 3809]|uniref:hypothetical protein n=1 Tax=Bradyrhizobium sp. STM 3809 TaxID=551936 RepID=UPI0011118B40|nr:hypothetical protein [Bradyrhizobium sp. STM 3809]